jgi:hypothetical protein
MGNFVEFALQWLLRRSRLASFFWSVVSAAASPTSLELARGIDKPQALATAETAPKRARLQMANIRAVRRRDGTFEIDGWRVKIAAIRGQTGPGNGAGGRSYLPQGNI